MVSVTPTNIRRVVQAELDRQPSGDFRLIANLFIRKSNGSWIIRCEPQPEHGANAMQLADRLVEAEDRLEEQTGVRFSLMPVIVDDLGLIGAEIIDTGASNGI